MISYLRFQLKRRTRRMRRRLHTASLWFAHYLDRHVYGAWKKLGQSKYMFIAWVAIIFIALIGLLYNIQAQSQHYLTHTSARGGEYSEGLVGEVTGVNPLFIDSPAAADVSSVVYSGLTRVNDKREIVTDLARSIDISADKKTYTFTLKDNIYWQDNVALTADDIAFTIATIQNPDTRSNLASNWKGVKVEVLNAKTIRFTLPNSYTSFLANTTVGIIPKHILQNVRPSLLKTHEFNQKPIGTGPFKLAEIQNGTSELELQAFDKYYLGRPNLDSLHFILYPSTNDFIGGYARKQILGFPITKPEQQKKVESIDDIQIHHLSLPVYTAAFFNMKSPQLSDIKLRQALAYSINREEIINNEIDGQATKAYYPVLAGYPGYDPALPRYDYNPQQAKQLAAEIGADKLKATTISLATLKDSVYEQVAGEIKDSWEKIGIKVEVIALPSDQFTQSIIRPRAYDVVLYGQDVGIDSDVYAFWHSSQASDPGLNLSQYANGDTDKALEAGRIAKDPAYKSARYNDFLQQWTKDVPAVILYTPFYNYAQNDEIKGFAARKIAQPSDRFYNIQNWYINDRLVTKASQQK